MVWVWRLEVAAALSSIDHSKSTHSNRGLPEQERVMNNDETINVDTRGKRPAFFESAEGDALMTALLETMSQLWATRMQVRTLKELLIQKGVLSAEELEQFELSDSDKQQDQQLMQEFFADAFRTMGAPTQSIDSRQKEVDKFQGYQATGE
ncbi:MAG: hypothetical protein ACI8RN_002599 [Glaciecola sp.]|jgi:hypothetical protein